jgi:hypothetical protein
MQGIEFCEKVFKVLNTNADLKAAISGSVYSLVRPEGSTKEDVVINYISNPQQVPQTPTLNVNVYVPDNQVTINLKQQYTPAQNRLKTVTAIVTKALKEARVYGMTLWIEKDTLLDYPDIHQHCSNLRIRFNSQITD